MRATQENPMGSNFHTPALADSVAAEIVEAPSPVDQVIQIHGNFASYGCGIK